MSELKRILLVEDDRNDVELILAAMAKHRLANEVEVLGDGADALDYLFRRGAFAGLSTAHPLVVLLDIKLPRVDGIEVLRQIKADPELAVIPTVMLTSSREERDRLQSYQLGANAYVVKPLDFKAFLEAVGELGVFWALINEPPPGALPRGKPA